MLGWDGWNYLILPGNWSGLFRTGFFQIPSSVDKHSLTPWLSLGSRILRWVLRWFLGLTVLSVSLLPPESRPLYATPGLYFVIVALLDGDFLPLVISPRRPEMMPVYLRNIMKVVIWGTWLLVGLRKKNCSVGSRCWWNRVISESSPGSENSDVIHIHCQGCSFMTLEV